MRKGTDIGFATVGFVVFVLLILLFTGFHPLQNGKKTDGELPQITLTVCFTGKPAAEPAQWFLYGDAWRSVSGNSTTVVFHNISARTPFSALETACSIAGWSLKYDNYSYGKLVVSVNGYTNGDNATYWQYWVNGVYASVSSDSYMLSDGDAVLWSFSNNAYGG